MKIIKRSQLAILSIAFMLMIAGYINYKYDSEREKNLGKTVYVNGSDVHTYNTHDNSVYTEVDSKNTNLYRKKLLETMSSFKSSRDTYFSELEESYKSAISNNLLTSEQIKSYQDKLSELVAEKHLITTIENLIKAKNIEDIVIVPTDGKFNIVVKTEDKLTASQIAIIEKTVTDELKTESKNITITQVNDYK